MALEVPGTKIEGAVANVAEDAGKTLVGAVRTRLSAWADRKAAVDLAEAEQIRLDVAAEGERKRNRTAIADRRQFELEEIEHRRALIERARGRVLDEIAHQQAAIEYVGDRAFTLNAADPEKSEERVIEDDWLRRFYRYAAEVDERTILEIFAQALSDAAIRTKPLLSPRALDTLRFFEPHTKTMFETCAQAVGAFEALPRGFLENHAGRLGRDLDLSLLLEMGLLKYEKQSHYLVIIGGFRLHFYFGPAKRDEFELVRLTHVGRSIAGLFSPELRRLGDPLSFPGSGEDLLALQESLALGPETALSLGKSLVAMLSNVEEVEFLASVDGRDRLKGAKTRYHDPFGLVPMDLSGLSDQARALVSCLLEEFGDYDSGQRHALREAAEAGSQKSEGR
jgi:hypothetical protein